MHLIRYQPDRNVEVYIIRCSNSDFYKIGHTQEVEKRLRDLQLANPYELTLVYKHSNKYGKTLERFFHYHLKKVKRHVRGEWFKLSLKEVERIISDIKWLEKTYEHKRMALDFEKVSELLCWRFDVEGNLT